MLYVSNHYFHFQHDELIFFMEENTVLLNCWQDEAILSTIPRKYCLNKSLISVPRIQIGLHNLSLLLL